MSVPLFYIPGNQQVQRSCGKTLKDMEIQLAQVPGPKVTHLLLPVPSFNDNGTLKCGGDISELLDQLPETITILGGNLPEKLCQKYKTIDLLKDPQYIAENAYITAYCAMRIIMMELPVILRHCKILIVGWGRIAQCLANLLRSAEADVTVATRCEKQRALAKALGYKTVSITDIVSELPHARVICNTAPANIISETQAKLCDNDCLKLDLASSKGICGNNVLWARGLPGKDAPESSGKLIAETVVRLIDKEESS